MKKIIGLLILIVIAICFFACESKANIEKPSDADLVALKIYHHMVYMETAAKHARGTNNLLHTKETM